MPPLVETAPYATVNANIAGARHHPGNITVPVRTTAAPVPGATEVRAQKPRVVVRAAVVGAAARVDLAKEMKTVIRNVLPVGMIARVNRVRWSALPVVTQKHAIAMKMIPLILQMTLRTIPRDVPAGMVIYVDRRSVILRRTVLQTAAGKSVSRIADVPILRRGPVNATVHVMGWKGQPVPP